MRVKYTTSVDPWVLKQASRVAKARGSNVAALIEDGLLRIIAAHDQEAVMPPLSGDDDAKAVRAADLRHSRGAA